MLLIFDRFKEAIKRTYRKKVIKEKIRCKHNNFSIVGDITLINRHVTIGKNVTIYPGVMLFGQGPIVIGDNVDIGKDTVIFASKDGGVVIGDNTLIAAQCYIIDSDHGFSRNMLVRDQNNTVARVSIGKDCWIGANATILKGSKINDGSVIGAKALVKGETPPYSVSVGVPCKTIKIRE